MRFPYRTAGILPTVVILLSALPALSRPADDPAQPANITSTSSDSIYSYHTVPGKLMGVWPATYTVQQLVKLRTRYGFTHVVVTPDSSYNIAILAGFPPSNIMVALYELHNSVDNYPAGMYYRDEPSEHDCAGHNKGGHVYSPSELLEMTYYIHQTRPGSMSVISGYKRCSHNNDARNCVDAFMYSSYQNWDDMGFPFYCHPNLGWGNDWETGWAPGNQDQRDSWTSMRAMCGGVNFMNWINGASDEYFNLFAHANYLGLVGLWQWYPGPIDSSNLELYCLSAWQNGWMTRTAAGPLPIQLASFTARLIGGNRVLLNWMTLSETNNYGFEVQRRAISTDIYAAVPNGFVPGSGTTLDPHEYSFVDSTAGSGKWYYRLKQIDLDGSASYSLAQEVTLVTDVQEGVDVKEALLHQNYPNPFNPSTTITYAIPTTRKVTIKIFDLLGREVATVVEGVMAPGRHRTVWNAEGRPSGVYVMRLEAGDIVQSKKVVVMK